MALAEKRDSESQFPFDDVKIIPRLSTNIVHRVLLTFVRLLSKSFANKLIEINQQKRFYNIISRFNPDIIYASYGHGGVTMAPIAKSLAIPLLVSFHGADASRRARIIEWKKKFQAMFEIASIVTGPSDHVRNNLIELGCPRHKARTLHNGVHLDRIPFKTRILKTNEDPVRFLFVGRLSPKKDPITLVRSIALAVQMLADRKISLTLIGDGPLLDQIRREIETLKLSGHIRLMGRLPHEKVLSEYQNAHIYVQHSITAADGDQEGLPVSITEALASGLPVISTKHSGIPEVVSHGENGYLVDEGDTQAMASFMAELARADEKWPEFGRHGRKLLEEEFAMPLVQRELMSLLSEAIRK